ncbi:unnamed protein product [Blepharisma stoltei]|uniref:Uncharacterized protein n=1 Tax=Blepharisma stoltei TaxID=1481888 RepID=A0AAU9JD94_9CILI|nr:unnamed protein product [Blepharisma stoltei]
MTHVHPAFKTAETIYANEIYNFIHEIHPKRRSLNNSPLSSKDKFISLKNKRFNRGKHSRFSTSFAVAAPNDQKLDYLPASKLHQRIFDKPDYDHLSLTEKVNLPLEKSQIVIAPKLPPLRTISPTFNKLIPFDLIKSSRSSTTNKDQLKELHCSALDKLVSVCQDAEDIPKVSKKVNKEVKLIERFSERINWTTDTLKQFEDYDHSVIRHMFHHFSLIKEDLNKEISEISHQMKAGTNDQHLVNARRRRKSVRKDF